MDTDILQQKDKKNNLLLYFIYSILFLSFLFSSYDTFLSFKVKGFTVRTSQLLLIIFMVIVLFQILFKNTPLVFPIGYNFLILWAFFILLFIPNTTLLSRNIGYGVWLIFHILLITVFVSYVNNEKAALTILKLYITSFFINSLLLNVVFILAFSKGITIPMFNLIWRGGIPRVALFSYEPSYFSTYLIAGLVLTIYLWIKDCKLFRHSYWLIVFIFIEVLAIFLSNARSGYIVFTMFILFLLFEQVYILIKKKRINYRYIIIIVIFFICIMFFYYTFKKVFKGAALEHIFLDTGIYKGSNLTVSSRLNAARDTFKVFLNHPFIGVSLGGIPAARGELLGQVITSQSAAKQFEGMTVLLEILAASCVIGFILFLLYFMKTLIKPLLENNIILKALVISLIIEFILLQFNQNIQRLYFWLHIAVLSMFYSIYGKGKERLMRLKTFW